MPDLIHDLLLHTASARPEREALKWRAEALGYGELARRVSGFAHGCLALRLARQDRVAVWADKRVETVVALCGAASPCCPGSGPPWWRRMISLMLPQWMSSYSSSTTSISRLLWRTWPAR